MTDRPIIFSGPMVRALLAGRKTQTRTLLRLPPAPAHLGAWEASTVGGVGLTDSKGRAVPERACAWHTRTGEVVVPRYAVGDRLYVREAFAIAGIFTDVVDVRYKASERGSYSEFVEQVPVARAAGAKLTWPQFRSSRHMPRWASRLTLIVEAVRVEPLQAISEADAIAEGSQEPSLREQGGDLAQAAWSERQVYQRLWSSLHTKPGERWEDNPMVVALTFRVEQRNIDAKGAA